MFKHRAATIFIIEDDPGVCKSLAWLFGSIHLKTETYSNPDAYLQAYNPNQYGCLLIDIRLPGMSGLQLLELLVQRHNPIPVIIITGHGDISLAIRAMKLGAKDFILKPFNDDLLLEQIQKILLESWEEQEFYQKFHDCHQKLTVREREIMERIVKGELNKVIAHDLSISLSTVEVHRANIMQKLQVKSITDLVKIHLLMNNKMRS
jgi:two-component system response regulator FixJ